MRRSASWGARFYPSVRDVSGFTIGQDSELVRLLLGFLHFGSPNIVAASIILRSQLEIVVFNESFTFKKRIHRGWQAK